MAFVKNNVFPNIRFVLNALGQHMRGIQASKKPKYMSKSQKKLGAALRFRGLLFWIPPAGRSLANEENSRDMGRGNYSQVPTS